MGWLGLAWLGFQVLGMGEEMGETGICLYWNESGC